MIKKTLIVKIDGKEIESRLSAVNSHGMDVMFVEPVPEIKFKPVVIEVRLILER